MYSHNDLGVDVQRRRQELINRVQGDVRKGLDSVRKNRRVALARAVKRAEVAQRDDLLSIFDDLHDAGE